MTHADTSGTIDTLFIGQSAGTQYQALLRWSQETDGLSAFVPDYHRLQLEYWIWGQREDIAGGRVLDIGVDNPRAYLGQGYFALGENGGDVRGDLCNLPLADDCLDTVLCTEVLEHCLDPFRAVAEMRRVLRPGGRLLVTSPFLWPDHTTVDYGDYWRFTAGGWRYLLRDFIDVSVRPFAWTLEGGQLYDLLRRFEGWGYNRLVEGVTAYACTARKGARLRDTMSRM